jgi:vesicle-fusing ATPase
MLTDLQMTEVFDADLRVPPISSLRSLEKVLKEVDLFSNGEERRRAMSMLDQAGFGNGPDGEPGRLQIGVKKLLSIIEMARQEPEEVAERLVGALVNLGM